MRRMVSMRKMPVMLLAKSTVAGHRVTAEVALRLKSLDQRLACLISLIFCQAIQIEVDVAHGKTVVSCTKP
jgi:hypothetical protein